MESNERIDLENRLTKIEGTLENISSILRDFVSKFSGHTHPEIERDYSQVKKDLNDVGQKCERIRTETEEKLHDMDLKIKEQESLNIKQELLLQQIRDDKKDFSSRFWTIATGVSVVLLVSLMGFLLRTYTYFK